MTSHHINNAVTEVNIKCRLMKDNERVILKDFTSKGKLDCNVTGSYLVFQTVNQHNLPSKPIMNFQCQEERDKRHRV